jgi:GNAT superfamily N-acetyltransferase
MTYLLFKDAELVAYIRAIEDMGYAIYICDLLVDQHHRGHGFGKMLIEHVKSLYPMYEIYVMSDVDPYYIKQGYKKIGSIFEI